MARKKRVGIFAIIILIFAIVMTSVVFSCGDLWILDDIFTADTASALNTANSANAYSVGSKGDGSALTEAWTSSLSEFNEEVMDDLVAAISPSGVVLKDWLNSKAGQVATAAEIRSNVQNNKGKTQGVLFKLGGIDWMVSYLTLTDIDGVDSVVATLYANEPIARTRFNQSNAGVDYNNAQIRTTMKSHASLAFFMDDASNEEDFSDLYIVKPENIAWEGSGQKNTSNSTYQDTADNWGESSAWKTDTVWIPSLYEVHSKDGKYEGGTGLWELSNEQKGFNSNSSTNNGYSWLRSAYSDNVSMILVGASVYCNFGGIIGEYGIRPAIHLNLTSATLGAAGAPKNPDDVTPMDYDGKDHTLVTLAAEGKAPDWYKEKNYEGTTAAYSGEDKNNGETVNYEGGESRMSVTYYTSKDVPVDAPHDADVYWVKAEITQGWQNEENAKAKLAGRDSRTIEFDGKPDTSDNEHLESGTVRWFRFTISKKKIAVNLSKGDDGFIKATVTSGLVPNDVGTSLAPTIGIKYSNASYTFNPPNKPDKVGTYSVTPTITAPDPCNYEIDTSAITGTTTYEKGKTQVTVPDVMSKTKPYNGSEQSFQLTSYDNIRVIADNGMTYDPSDGTLTAKDAKKYTVTVTVQDSNEYEWKDGTDKSRTVTINLEITKLSLNVTINSSATNPWQWRIDDTPTITVAEDSLADDSVELNIYYYKTSNPSATVSLNAQKKTSADGKSFTVVMPTLEIGDYALGVSLSNSQDNSNYAIANDAATQTLKIIGRAVTFSNPVWKLDNTVLSDITNLAYTYTGSTFAFSVDETDLRSHGVEIDTAKGTNGYSGTGLAAKDVGTNYTVTVNLKAMTGYEELTKTAYDLKFSITQAKYDLSGVTWDYDPTKLIYNEAMQYVNLQNLPKNLTASYSSTNAKSDVSASGYTAIATLANGDTKNYITPNRNDKTTYIYNDPDGGADFPWTLDWNITPQEINTSPNNWIEVAQAYNGTQATRPKLAAKFDTFVDYTFEEWDEATQTGTPIALEDITIDLGNAKEYRVCAVVKTGVLNYVVGSQDNPHKFTLGTNRTAITLTITSDTTFTFDGTAKDVTFTSDKLNPDTNFTISYINGAGQTLDGAPAHAGNYKVQIALKADSGVNVDDYFITNGEPVDLIINPATVDLSNIKWNYDSDNPFTYLREGGEVKTQKVELVGWDTSDPLHAYVKSLLQYSGTTQESNVSPSAKPYLASFSFVGLVESDFMDFNLPAELKEDSSLSWHILKLKLNKPAYDGENIVFSNENIDLLQLFGIADGWAEYFTINAKYNNNPTSDFVAKNIGTYAFVCQFVAGLGDNVSWDDDDIFAATPSVTVDPLVINVSGWSSATIPAPLVQNQAELDFINAVYTDVEGNAVTLDFVRASHNTSFRVAISSKFGDNVIIRTADGVQSFAEFSTPSDPNNPPVQVAKPTLENDVLPYTSKPVTFGVIGFNDAYMTMQGGLTYTDEGEYQIIIRFRDGVNYCWDDGSRDPVTLTFTVFNDPDNPYVPPQEPSFLDKIKEFINSGFPLWQVATMAVSALLSLIFLIKSIQYGNRRKKIVGKKNSVKVAGLLPIFSSEVVLAGLSNQIWSIMAFALAGLALLLFIVALITRSAWKKALRARDEAQGVNPNYPQFNAAQNALVPGGQFPQGAPYMQGGYPDSSFFEKRLLEMEERYRQREEAQRRDDEERRREMEERHREEMARREEEQAQRDEAMKMMLARMMGRTPEDDGDMPYYGTVDDTDLLVQKVIAGLLPAVQQMMPETTAYLTAPAYEQSASDIEAIADRVAEKLGANIPQNNLDVDEIVQKVSAKITPVSQGNVNLDDLAQKVSEKITPVSNTTVVQGASAEEM
ncbi:MAG: hypothetical protein NC179_05795, partial [[Eubacterium] siraeum]|nr:hypothetical protein [[Eubacterium] siraeum]